MSDNYKFSTLNQEGEPLELQFLPETRIIREKCKLGYAQAYKYYFEEGAMTRAQAVEIGREKGVLSKEWEDELNTCTQDLILLRAQIDVEKAKKRPPKKKLQDLEDKFGELYRRYQELSTRQSDILGATCENMADNRELELNVALRCADMEGNLLFNGDHETLMKRHHELMVQDAIEHMLFVRMRVPYRMKGLITGEEEQVTESAT